MIDLIKKIFNLNQSKSKMILAVLILSVLIFPIAAHASIEGKIINGVANIVYGIVYFLGMILTFVIGWLRQVAQYNDFVNTKTVVTGWLILRDICNMFFIVALLFIAFATILRMESYNVKKLLPKLLIMAVLINFSRTICGIVIDLGQIVMMTFVNGFTANSGYNNLVANLGIDKLLSMTDAVDSKNINGKEISSLAVLGGLLTALIAALITFVVIFVAFVILLMRVVFLWIYIIFSPLAFFSAALPQTSKYFSQWWGDFVKYVIVGPVLAFFIWLALATAQESAAKLSLDPSAAVSSAGSNQEGFESGLPSDFLTNGTFQTYLITIGLLVGGLVITQQAGGQAAKFAGTGMGWIQKGRASTTKYLGDRAWGVGKTVGRTGLSVAKGADAVVLKGFGTNIATAVRDYKAGGAAGGIATGAALGSLAGPIGAAIGAGLGAIVGSKVEGKIRDTVKSKRNNEKARLNASMEGDKGDLLDENGKKTTRDKAKYHWNSDEGRYQEFTVGTSDDGEEFYAHKEGAYKDANGENVHRWGKFKDEKDNEYARFSEDDKTYYRINSKGQFLDEKGKPTSNKKDLQAAKSAVFGDVKEMGNAFATFFAAYASSQNKSWTMQDAADGKAISDLKADYNTMSKEMLQKLLEIEKDSTKKAAIALTLGVKKGFKDVDQVFQAKEALGGNSVLLKEFNEAMNKTHMVMNNTRADGTVDDGAIAKLVSSGDAKWADQDSKTMNKQALDIMAKQMGINFHTELEKIIKTDRDKENIKKALKVDLDIRDTEEGTIDLQIRKSAGSITGDWIEAFTKKGTLDAKALKEAIAKIPKASIFGDINNDVLEDEDFKKILADSIDITQIKKMASSNDIDPVKFKKIIAIIKEQAPTSKNAEYVLDKMEGSSQLKDNI